MSTSVLDPLATRSVKLFSKGLSLYVASRRRRGELPYSSRVTFELDIAFTPRGGKQAVDVYLPRAEPATADGHPFLVFVHGGGWISGDRSVSAVVGHVLAGHGVAVVAPGYRLAPRHGLDEQLADVQEATRFVHDHADRWRLDTRRWAMGGESAGAHLAMRSAQEHAPDLPPPSAIVGIYGFYDLVAWLRHRDLPAPGFMLRCLAGGQRPEDFVAAHTAMRPMPWPDVPVLLLHGKEDRLSPHGQSMRFAELLREHGTAVELELFEGVGHAFIYMRGRHSKQLERAYRRLIDFLRFRLGIPED